MDLSLQLLTSSGRGVPIPNVCNVCSHGEETTEHALKSCLKAAEAWRAAGVALSNGDESFEVWLQKLLSGPNKELSCKVAMLAWGLWKRRNSLVWEDEMQETANLLNSCACIFLRGGRPGGYENGGQQSWQRKSWVEQAESRLLEGK
ncbi:unnamed protein product, partial [Cuscuta epithymum]